MDITLVLLNISNLKRCYSPYFALHTVPLIPYHPCSLTPVYSDIAFTLIWYFPYRPFEYKIANYEFLLKFTMPPSKMRVYFHDLNIVLKLLKLFHWNIIVCIINIYLPWLPERSIKCVKLVNFDGA